MGIYLTGSREEKEVQRLSQSNPTTAADKVNPSVTAPIILNTLYNSSQWPYIPSPPKPSVSCFKLQYGHYLLMAHVCFWVYTDPDAWSFICSPATGAHADIIAQILTVSCPACSQICTETSGAKRGKKRGGSKDKKSINVSVQCRKHEYSLSSSRFKGRLCQWALRMNFPDNEASFWGNVKQQWVEDQIAIAVT